MNGLTIMIYLHLNTKWKETTTIQCIVTFFILYRSIVNCLRFVTHKRMQTYLYLVRPKTYHSYTKIHLNFHIAIYLLALFDIASNLNNYSVHHLLCVPLDTLFLPLLVYKKFHYTRKFKLIRFPKSFPIQMCATFWM